MHVWHVHVVVCMIASWCCEFTFYISKVQRGRLPGM